VTAYGQQVDVPAKPPRPHVCAKIPQVWSGFNKCGQGSTSVVGVPQVWPGFD
jgi:hypothetical protein